MVTFLILLTFGAGFLLVFGINLLIADIAQSHRDKVRKRLENEDELRHEQRSKRIALRQAAHQPVQEVAEDPHSLTLWQNFEQLIIESGMPVRPINVLGACVALGLATGLIVQIALHIWMLSVLAGAIASYIPIIYVSSVRRQRLRKLLSQLPDAFDLMGRSMRSGQTISQAMQSVADDFSAPACDEFGYCCDQQNLGLSPETTMRALARRTGLLEIKIFVLAVMVHRQTGGNLAELLDKLSSVIRERQRINGSIQAKTAEGRAQMVVLLALPPLIFCVMFAINRPFAVALFNYPQLLAGTVAMMCVGAFSMNRIISFDF